VGAIEQGLSPLTLKEVMLGKYPVRARAAGYEDWSGEVEVKENEFAELNAALERSTGNLRLTSEPTGLEVEVNGRVTASALPLTGRQVVRTPQSLKLATGSYSLVFRRAGWPEQSKTVEIGRNLSAASVGLFVPGSLEFTSEPSGAEVELEGKTIGVTPLTLPDVQPGQKSAELSLKGYKNATVSGAVTARTALKLNAVLEPKSPSGFGTAINNLLGAKPTDKPAAASTAPGILTLVITKAPPAPCRFTLVLIRSDITAPPQTFPIDESVTQGRNADGDVATKFNIAPGTYTFVVKSSGNKDVTSVRGGLFGLGRKRELTIKPGGDIALEVELEAAKPQ
jgi:PEGA domain